MRMQQLDVLSKESLYVAPDDVPAGSIGAMQPSKGDMVPPLAEDERSTPLVADPAERRLVSFDIDRVQVGRRTRAVNTERLGTLSCSFLGRGAWLGSRSEHLETLLKHV